MAPCPFHPVNTQALDSLLLIAMDNTRQVNTLQLAFLIAEGCGVSVLAAALLAYLLRRLAVQRYTLYGIFLVIPIGLTRALTSQISNSLLLEVGPVAGERPVPREDAPPCGFMVWIVSAG